MNALTNLGLNFVVTTCLTYTVNTIATLLCQHNNRLAIA